MTGRQILVRGWKAEGELSSLQERVAEMARTAVFEKISYKQMGRFDPYVEKLFFYFGERRNVLSLQSLSGHNSCK